MPNLHQCSHATAAAYANTPKCLALSFISEVKIEKRNSAEETKQLKNTQILVCFSSSSE
jgi:hypothetical protein